MKKMDILGDAVHAVQILLSLINIVLEATKSGMHKSPINNAVQVSVESSGL